MCCDSSTTTIVATSCFVWPPRRGRPSAAPRTYAKWRARIARSGQGGRLARRMKPQCGSGDCMPLALNESRRESSRLSLSTTPAAYGRTMQPSVWRSTRVHPRDFLKGAVEVARGGDPRSHVPPDSSAAPPAVVWEPLRKRGAGFESTTHTPRPQAPSSLTPSPGLNEPETLRWRELGGSHIVT